MELRRAYVGLSSPIFYDYNNNVAKTKSDRISSPNPILESPFGLLLLYDEIWFLCKSLCPYNMRKLSYVKFIDEIYPDIDFKTINLFVDFLDIEGINKSNKKINPLNSYNALTKLLCVDTIQARTDNHNHSLRIGNDFEIYASSADLYLLLFDINMTYYFKDIFNINIELITNSFTNQFFVISKFQRTHQLELAEALTIKNIPNYLTKSGPYHPVIEEAREDKYLAQFRKWIITDHNNLDRNEIKDIVQEVENSINTKKVELFSKYLDQKTYYKSIGETVLGVMTDLFFPYLSTGKSTFADLKALSNTSKLRWQGFVSDFDKMYFKTVE